MQEWLKMSAADLGRGIAAGEIDPVDLTEVYLAAIDAHPLKGRIYTCVTSDRAMAEARAASERARSGLRRGPLDGVPASWKDLFDSAGTPTEAGTAMLAGRRPERDAAVLQAATGAGMICLGKTHMSEIAFSGLGYNPVTATPPCINDDAAVPGGSSSGAAASVAFGLAPLGIGSDTGGSVRLPSAWNDLVGFKPSHGALSLEGVVPLCPAFDTVGPLCRTVEDAALAFQALGGAPVDLGGSSLSGRRFLLLETIAQDDLEEAPSRAFAAAVARLRDAGAEVVAGAAPDVTEAFALTAPLYAGEAYAEWRDVLAAHGNKMFAQVYQRVMAGQSVMAHDYLGATRRLAALRSSFAKRVAGFDAILAPSCAILPPNRARVAEDADYYVSSNLMALRNTRIGNLMGLCGVSLPTGTPSCGLMMMAQPRSDARLLRLAAAAERALT